MTERALPAALLLTTAGFLATSYTVTGASAQEWGIALLLALAGAALLLVGRRFGNGDSAATREMAAIPASQRPAPIELVVMTQYPPMSADEMAALKPRTSAATVEVEAGISTREMAAHKPLSPLATLEVEAGGLSTNEMAAHKPTTPDATSELKSAQ